MSDEASAAGWKIKPEIVMTILAMIMATGSSYLALERDDSKAVAADIREHDRKLIGLERDLLHLASTNARCERERLSE